MFRNAVARIEEKIIRPALLVMLGFAVGAWHSSDVNFNLLSPSERPPLQLPARQAAVEAGGPPAPEKALPFELPLLNATRAAANWRRLTTCRPPAQGLGYPTELGGVSNMARHCHFSTSAAFGAPDPQQIARSAPPRAQVTQVLGDLYYELGILSSKRAGSMLGLYRAGGYLKGDDGTGDHFLFLPDATAATLDCVSAAVDAVARRRNCTFGGFSPFHDALNCDVSCTVGGHAFTSHGTCYTARYLLYDVDKNERLAKYGVYVHDALRSLCFAPYDGVPAMVFDTPHVQALLSAQYGDDFLTPNPKKKNAVPKWMLATNKYVREYQTLDNYMDPHTKRTSGGPSYLFRGGS